MKPSDAVIDVLNTLAFGLAIVSVDVFPHGEMAVRELLDRDQGDTYQYGESLALPTSDCVAICSSPDESLPAAGTHRACVQSGSLPMLHSAHLCSQLQLKEKFRYSRP